MDQCGRGLYCLPDGSGAGDVGTCEPVCNTNADCHVPGEMCLLGAICGVPCDPAVPSSCPVDAVCLVNMCETTATAATCAGGALPPCPGGLFCLNGGATSSCITPEQMADMICPPGTCDGPCTTRPCGGGG
jgi:hypothetical protein